MNSNLNTENMKAKALDMMPTGVTGVVVRSVAQFVLGATAAWVFISIVEWLFGVMAAFWVAVISCIAIWAWLFAMFVPASWLGRDDA